MTKTILDTTDKEELQEQIAANKVHIRYSANADGTDFTENWQNGQNYIGFATGQTAPTNKLAYTWSLFSCGDINAELDNLLTLQEEYINL